MSYPERVTVFEVGPRDGLQNEATPISTEIKVEFVDRLTAAGLPAIEATSFVSPKAVPQLADGAEVMTAIERRGGTRYPVLVPNLRGYERAREVGAVEIAVFTAASESFNQKNIRCGIDESFERFEPVFEAAEKDGVRVRGYVSTAFLCPYEGAVEPSAAGRVIGRLLDRGCFEVSIGDTIGAAVPRDVHRLLDDLAERNINPERLALHMHDTRGTALANVVAGLERGVAVFDSSTGGLGGCPYAPGAAGNLATEDLVYLLDRMGIASGVDLEEVIATGRWVAEQISGRQVASRVGRSGPFCPLGG